MSLRFIIDGYNIIHHQLFQRHKHLKRAHPWEALFYFILSTQATGSARNTVVLVFDGFPGSHERVEASGSRKEIRIIFSREESADAVIKAMIKACAHPRSTVVVSDDRDIRQSARLYGVRRLSVEEFMEPVIEKEKKKQHTQRTEPTLNYSQMSRINREVSALWLTDPSSGEHEKKQRR